MNVTKEKAFHLTHRLQERPGPLVGHGMLDQDHGLAHQLTHTLLIRNLHPGRGHKRTEQLRSSTT